jgi:hypothetical protein
MLRTAFVILSALLCAPAFVFAQAAQPGPRASNNQDQWISHQMHQPPPKADRYEMSPERLQEIRELYQKAKQDADKSRKKLSNDG